MLDSPADPPSLVEAAALVAPPLDPPALVAALASSSAGLQPPSDQHTNHTEPTERA